METVTADRKIARPGWTPKTVPLEEIIAEARALPAGPRGALVVSCLMALLMWGSFTPLDLGPLGWICLAPLCLLLRLERPTRAMYRSVYLGGLAFWVASLQWMRLGDTAMYGAWGALSVYMALFVPLFVWLARTAVWRWKVPVTLAAPVVWTGLELFRGFFMTGFAWYYLGHTQHRFTDIVQICDLCGVYGVSFLLAAFGACAAELAPQSWFRRLGLLPAAGPANILSVSSRGQLLRIGCCLALFASAWIYGIARRSGVEFPAGPRVALIQGDFECELEHDEARWIEIQRTHERLTGEAVLQQPDFVVWPETMFRWPLLQAPEELSDADLQRAHPRYPVSALRDPNISKRLSDLAQMGRMGLIIGLSGMEMDLQSVRRYNSAVLVQPDGTIGERYDKLHRVPFGEYVPMNDTLPWLQKLTPYPEDFGIDKGRGVVAYESGGYRFSPIICFEDTVPHLVLGLVKATTAETAEGSRPIDFLVNLTNDGWFRGSNEHEQHLITGSFRCIETRTPMVRAVNTGISAIIDGDGQVRHRSEKATETVVVGTVPLDPRTSLYVATGDWLAGSCLACCGFLAVFGIVPRRRLQTVTATRT